MAAVSFDSSRFGTLEVAEDAVITFPQGLIGLGGSRYALVGAPDDAIVWLHSVEDPALAVPVAHPWAFFPDYAIDLADEDADIAKTMIDYTTQQSAMTAGLKAGASIVQNSLLDFLR